jgi:predicted aldo/keto reductase-like oxidoreductase
MKYCTDIKSGNQLSILGFGCMRFPKNLTQIDYNKSEQLIVKAVQEGINYFDTAFVYSGSEEALGKIISKNNLRDKMYLATKLPYPKCKTYSDFDSIFQKQLDRLHTNYIDYYLIHCLVDVNSWKILCELGIKRWIDEKKASGQIKNLGFSFHGIHEEFMQLLDLYDWDFCQIQYNYIDVHYQAGVLGLKKAYSKGIPVIVMEPLLGGKLATGLPKKVMTAFKQANPTLTPAEWALRWVWNQKEVTLLLSGMSDMAQLEENIKIAENAAPGMLTEAENKTYESVIKIINDTYKIPCTGCNYCMPCPHNVNIPACFSAYNTAYTLGFSDGIKQYLTSTGALHPSRYLGAGNCKACGICEKKCPQNIPVIDSLKKVKKKMESFWVKTMVKIYFLLNWG